MRPFWLNKYEINKENEKLPFIRYGFNIFALRFLNPFSVKSP